MAQFKWGINNDYAPLKHVLLGKPEYYKWVDAGPLIGRTLLNAHKTGIKFDLQTAMSQHAEMVAIRPLAETDDCLLPLLRHH